MDDLISRQAAIDALYHVDEYNGRSVAAIRSLPSAQPDVPDTNVGDLISREAMGEALDRIKVDKNETWYSFYQKALNELCKLPSAQPETAERTAETAQNVSDGDLISRKVAINDLKGRDPSQLWDTADIEVWINELTPVREWIPCSERLPEHGDEVLTTYIVNGNRKRRYVETATWYEGEDGYWSSPWDEYRVPGTRIEVIAWMPLPEPFGGEQAGGG